MGRKKKDGKFLNVYLERETLERFEEYCKEKGQTKTIAIERLMKEKLENEKKKDQV